VELAANPAGRRSSRIAVLRPRLLPFSGWLYRQRNLVERFFNRIKHFRGIATRYDKCSENYLAAVKLICARIWCAA
jgi:transposase